MRVCVCLCVCLCVHVRHTSTHLVNRRYLRCCCRCRAYRIPRGLAIARGGRAGNSARRACHTRRSLRSCVQRAPALRRAQLQLGRVVRRAAMVADERRRDDERREVGLVEQGAGEVRREDGKHRPAALLLLCWRAAVLWALRWRCRRRLALVYGAQAPVGPASCGAGAGTALAHCAAGFLWDVKEVIAGCVLVGRELLLGRDER